MLRSTRAALVLLTIGCLFGAACTSETSDDDSEAVDADDDSDTSAPAAE